MTGSFLDTFVAPVQAENGGLSYAEIARFGPDGNLYVTCWHSDSILRYDGTTGEYIDRFGGETNVNAAYGIAFGPDGNIYVANWFGSSVRRYDASTGALIDTFVTHNSGGLFAATELAFGPDGNLYVASFSQDRVVAFDGETGDFIGDFVPPGSGGLDTPFGMTFGPDDNLYVGSPGTNNVLRFDGTTGAFLGEFVTAFSGGLSNPRGVTFGPDGNLYVAGYGSKNVLRYDGETGEFIDVFADGGNPEGPSNLRFGPDGNLYLASMDHDRKQLPIDDDRVLRYDGTTGDYIDDYVPSLADGLWPPWGMFPCGLLFDADDNLLVSGNTRVLRYGPKSTAAFTVTLSTPSETPVSVDFSTADNTAVAGSDYSRRVAPLSSNPG